MNKTGTEETYIYHHISRRRFGKSAFGDIRGEFLRHHIGKGKRVLDIGCRDGVLTKTYCENNTVLGLDIDTNALKEAERSGISVKHADLNSNWNVEDGAFDAVVAGEVLEHLYYPLRIVEKVSRALKPTGIFIGSVPNAFSLVNRFRLFFGAKKNTPLADPTHINHFSRSELESILKNSFEDVSIEPLGRFSWLDRIFPGLFCFMFLFKASGKK